MKGISRTALVVDDEPMVLAYIADCLERLGFTVRSAESAGEALQMARREKLDVAFVDLALPDRSGIELMADLAAVQPGLPMIIASGYGDLALRDVDATGKHPPVLSKPFDQSDIEKQLAVVGLL